MLREGRGAYCPTGMEQLFPVLLPVAELGSYVNFLLYAPPPLRSQLQLTYLLDNLGHDMPVFPLPFMIELGLVFQEEWTVFKFRFLKSVSTQDYIIERFSLLRMFLFFCF